MDIGERIDQLFDEEPEAPAVQFNDAWWTWADMKRIRDCIDDILSRAHITTGTGIGIVLRERPLNFGAYLTSLNTHRCAVLVTPIQPDLPMCEDIEQLRLPALIADEEDWRRAGLIDACKRAGTIGIALTSDRLHPVRVVPGLETLVGGDRYEVIPGTAVTILTSGTTGAPKRIPLAFTALVGAPPEHSRPPFTRGVSIAAVPLVSIGGAIGVVNAVWKGRPTALMDRFDPLKWAKLVYEHKPRRLAAPPATLRMLLDRRVPKELLASGAVFSAASAPVDLATSDEFEAHYGIPVIRAYGATEFLGAVTGFQPEEYHLAREKRGSVGRAFPNTRVRIVDPETGTELSRGKIGLLEADPPQRPEGTPPGWIRTNDLARMDEDGFVWIEGRADGVLIRGGFKVPTDEVAEVLRHHPDVADAVVIGLPHPTLTQVPCALVEPIPGRRPPTEEELINLVKENKPPYYVPERIMIVEELPRNAMLKVVLSRVREILEG